MMENTLKSKSLDSVSKMEYFGYFSYGFGQCFSYGLVGSFILFFYTNILGISVAAASTIFLIARVWDAVNDPMVAGFMVEKYYMQVLPIYYGEQYIQYLIYHFGHYHQLYQMTHKKELV